MSLLPPNQLPPERIFGWQHSQLSIAKYYGGCKYNGHGYTIAHGEEGQPLVRNDVLKREAKTKRKANQEKGHAE